AHELINTLPDIGIDFLKLREPFYCARCEGIATDRTCGHEKSDREYISGTKIRKILVEGKNPEHHIFRNEVLESLRELGERGLFY
ncbi:sulfate adenylyltransferase, partial [Pseudomonas sp. FW305-20]